MSAVRQDDFIVSARRTLCRAARKARTENRRLRLPLITLTNGKTTKAPACVLCAERAFRRAAKNVWAEHRAMGSPVIIWEDGKMVEKLV